MIIIIGFHNALLCRRGKNAALIRKCQKVLVIAVLELHAGKAVVRVAAIEITTDHLLDIGPPRTILMGELLHRRSRTKVSKQSSTQW